MSILETLSLFGIMTALAVLPGAGVALVITRSVTLGVADGVAVSAGIVLGDLVFILLALLGLSVVAETMGSLFALIRYLGAAYLLWLGFSLLTSKQSGSITVQKEKGKRSLAASFLAGFFLTLGDIKAIVFYASLFPVFIDLSALRVADVLVVIAVMVVSVGGVKLVYALSATRVASLLASRRLDRVAGKTAGGLMVGAGGYLIIKA